MESFIESFIENLMRQVWGSAWYRGHLLQQNITTARNLPRRIFLFIEHYFLCFVLSTH